MSKSHILPIFDCECGCGQPAIYEFNTGLLCCSDNPAKCSGIRNKISNSRLDENYKHEGIIISKQRIPKPKEETKKITNNKDTHILPIFDCEFGCGQPARYQLKNGKLCCEEYTAKCPVLKKINSEQNSGEKNGFYGKHHTPESLKIIGLKSKGRQTFLGRHHTKETCLKLSLIRTGTHNSPESNEKNRISNTGKKMPPRTNEWRINQHQYMINGGSRKANLSKYGTIISKEDMSDFKLYNQLVWKFTSLSCIKKYTITELKQRGTHKKDKHLDHIFSISEGFRLKILPQIIGSKGNIELVSTDYNLSKNNRCDITLEELFRRFDEELKEENEK